MKKEITSDKGYIEAFNQGYELSKELGLKPEILKDLSTGNDRIEAMREGMEQYGQEITKDKDIIPPLDLDSLDNTHIDLDTITSKNMNKDVDLDI